MRSMFAAVVACGIAGLSCVRSAAADAVSHVPSVPFDAWTKLLATNVDEQGRVRYDHIERAALDEILHTIGETSPDFRPGLYPTKNAKLAYWVDAYNATVWAEVLARPGLKSVIDDKALFFDGDRHSYGGEMLTLNEVEGRARAFKDPRVHMALVCAAVSCPALAREAYTPYGVDAQLDRATRAFCNDERNVSYDAHKGTLSVSKIFDWYAADFGGTVAFVNRYRNDKVPAKAKVVFREYDWRLNGATP